MIKYPVIIAGAGIGHMDHVSIGVLREIQSADCIIYDRLMDQRLLDFAPHAETIDAGKKKDHHKIPQDDINALLVEKYLEGKRVLRLKGGDPYVFGRGGEEALYLKERDIPFTVYPGITSGVAVPALAGIPVTFRDTARAVTFLTAFSKNGPEDVKAYAALPSTLVIYMGLSRSQAIARSLIHGGKNEDTPMAILSKGGTEDMRSFYSTLKDVAENGIPDTLVSPSIIVVGDVVSLHKDLIPSPHCKGNIVLTFEDKQHRVSRLLEKEGYRVHNRPMIEIIPVDEEKLFLATKDFTADLVVLTSKNAVHYFLRSFIINRDIRDLKDVDFYTVGKKTDEALASYGIRSKGHPDIYDGKHLAKLLEKEYKGKHPTIFYPHSKKSDPTLGKVLAAIGNVVDLAVYDAADPGSGSDLPEGVNAVLFGSSSSVTNFFRHYRNNDVKDALFFAIGPSTKRTLLDHVIEDNKIYMAEKATFDSLCQCVVKELHHANAQNQK